MLVILVCGYRGHGKDFLGQCIKNSTVSKYFEISFEFPSVSQKLSFADAPKEILYRELFPGRKISSITREEKERHRGELIKLAQFFKENDKFYWVRKVHEKITSNTVICDWRFPEELEFLEKFHKIIKCRVVSSKAEIPPIEEITEHLLDDINVDVILKW